MKLKFSMLTYLTHINTLLEYYHASDSVINRSMVLMFCNLEDENVHIGQAI